MITPEEDKLRRQLNALMSTADSREWVWEHLGACGVFSSSYVSNSLDMSFNEGRRNVGLRLLADLQQHTFPLYQKMELEARARSDTENEVDDEFDN